METKDPFDKAFTLSLLYFILGVLSIISIFLYNFLGTLLGFFFIALGVWSFAEWRYKKIIPIRNAIILLPLLFLGAVNLLVIIKLNDYFEIISFYELLFAIIIIWIFFRKVKSA